MDRNKEIVFGIGWNRTGTRTLNRICRELGFKPANWKSCKHLSKAWAYGKINQFEKFILKNNYNAFSDAPWCFPEVYKFLYEKFPNAKFVLTIRDTEAWINSYKNLYERHIPNHQDLERLPFIDNEEEYGWVHPILFKGSVKITGNEHIYRQVFEAYNKEVVDFFGDKPNKLLVIDWSKENDASKVAKFFNKRNVDLELPWVKDKRRLYE